MEAYSFGKVAYDGYFAKCKGCSLTTGHPLLPWEDQPPDIRAAWTAGANRVVEHIEIILKFERDAMVAEVRRRLEEAYLNEN